MTYKFKALGVAAALALSPMAASAASVDINFTSFGNLDGTDTRDIAAATAALNAFMGSSPIIGAEDFEGFTDCPDTTKTCASASDTSAIESSNVGDFFRIGDAAGSGGSQVDPEDDIVVRMNNPTNTFSRYDVVGGQNWLDSNDHEGIRWEIPGTSGLSDILKIAFFLTDVDDVGSFDFEFTTTGPGISSQNLSGTPAGGRPDGELQLVTMLFNNPVDIISIEMRSGVNDGFGMDGIKVGTVPLPAAGWLMLAGFGGLAALRRRKRTA